MRYNKKTNISKTGNNEHISKTTTNKAGGEAFTVSSEFELISFLTTTFMKDTYYQTESEAITKLESLCQNYKNKEFLAKAAVYTRNEFGMRSVTHFVAAFLAKEVKGEKWTKHFYKCVFRRPDDITETLAIYMKKYGKPIPNSLKKGIQLALKKFNNYQISKYKAENGDVKMVDVVNLIHPKPTKDNTEAFEKLVKDELKNDSTWESMLSAAGQEENKDEAKKEVWTKLLKEHKLGYFALLRNLNNIQEQAPEIIPEAIKTLTNKDLIKSSLVLPFRFTTAYYQIHNKAERSLLEAVDTAAEISLDNVPQLKGRTVIFLDQSGSMQGQPSQIASLFTAILCKKLDCDVISFSDKAKYLNYNKKDSLMTLAKQLSSAADFAGTDFKVPFKLINDKQKPYDRIIILSDMQGWVGYDSPKKDFDKYCKELKVKPKVFSWDLSGHGTTQLPYEDIVCFTGWSDKVFDLIKLYEIDKTQFSTIISKIEFN